MLPLSQQQRPDPAPKALPPQLKTQHIRPRTFRQGDAELLLWTTRQVPDETTGDQLLRHLAAHSNSYRVGDLAPSELHRVFREDKVDRRKAADHPVNACITLDKGLCICPRSGGYTLVKLGYQTVLRGDQLRQRQVDIDAHRLVCWLVHGPPAEGSHVATHKCKGNKACVKPCHLEWNTQQENVRQASEEQSAKKAKRAGALLVQRHGATTCCRANLLGKMGTICTWCQCSMCRHLPFGDLVRSIAQRA